MNNNKLKIDKLTVINIGSNVPTFGTSLEGYIACTYGQLTELLGNPDQGDQWATQVKWSVEFNDGTVATVYDYQICKSYLGETGKDLVDNFDWHVSGSNAQALQNIQNILGLDDDAVLRAESRSDITQLQRYWDKIKSINERFDSVSTIQQ